MELKFKGNMEIVNEKPQDEYVLVAICDYNANYYSFYVYISLTNYKAEVKSIKELIARVIEEFNCSSEIYIEIVGFSKKLEEYYRSKRKSNKPTPQLDLTEITEEKIQQIFNPLL